MLARLLLLLVQLAIGYFAAPSIAQHVPSFGNLDIFVYAVIYAVLVTIVGFAGSLVLKGVGAPSAGTLAASIVVALIFAALATLPPVTSVVSQYVPGLRTEIYPLIGAVLGYMFKR